MVVFIDPRKYKFADRGDIAAIGKHLLACGHDLIGGDVVSEFQKDRSFDRIREWIEPRQWRDVGSLLELDFLAIRCGRDQHVRIDDESLRFRESRIFHPEGAWIRDYSCQRRSRSGFGAAQRNLILLRSRTAGEVARHGSETDPAGGRRLAHTDTTVTAGLVNPPSCPNEFPEHSHLG